MRGYPKGLRAGSDPRKPLVSVDEQFEKVEYRSVPSILYAIEVNSLRLLSMLLNTQHLFDLS